jgi:hypothetical protein
MAENEVVGGVLENWTYSGPFPSATMSGKPLLPSSSMGLFHGRPPHSGPPREIVQGGTRLLWGPEFRSLK